jgi:t-SNARE complex subunit (syntaxin)
MKERPMAVQRTFSIIKPDATRRNLTGKINAMIEDAGLRIVAQSASSGPKTMPRSSMRCTRNVRSTWNW